MIRPLRLTGIVLLILSVMYACKKPERPKTDFAVDGIHDLTLQENGTGVINLNIEHLANEAEQVTLSLANVPKGVSPNFNTVTAKPPFASNLYIKDDSSVAGTYDLVLVAKSARGIEKNYKFRLTTLEKTCAIKGSGTYRGTSFCRNGGGLIFSNFVFWVDSNYKDRIIFYWNKVPAYGIVNCNKGQFTIPYQPLTNYWITGTGYFDRNYKVIDIDYTERYKSGDTISCTIHFERL